MHPLERLRKERGLTQQQLAHMATVPRTTISQIEHGLRLTRSHRGVRKIAAALGVQMKSIVAPNQIDDRNSFESVAEFFDLDPRDPGTRPYLLQLKEAVHAPVR